MAEAITPIKTRRTLLLVVGLVLLLVAIAAAAAFFLIRNKQLEAYRFESDPSADGKAKAPAAPPASNSSKHVFTSLEMFTANLADRDRERFAQVAVMIEVGDLKAETALKAVIPIVRSEILLLLTAKSADELLTLQGKQTLARQILDIARKQITSDYRNQVYAVHFASFVIQ